MRYVVLNWREQLRVAPAIELTQQQESELTRLARSRLRRVRLARRARIVLLAAKGTQNKDIVHALGVGRVQVGRWRDRYVESGLRGIERDLPRGAPPSKVDATRLVGVDHAEQARGGDALEHTQVGCGAGRQCQHGDAALASQWPEAAHRAGFKVSRDPLFVEKLEDLVEL